MSSLPESLFLNPVWTALHSTHQSFALSNGDAARYPSAVVPFASLLHPTESALHQLHPLLSPGESVWVHAESLPQIPELLHAQTLQCFQMVLPESVSLPASTAAILPLTCANANEMVALTDVAFPGFFRPRTCEMGSYFGIRSSSGQLIAMGGERLRHPGYSELSAICTHPDFRGQGHAANLIAHLVELHRRNRIVPWLHVTTSNQNAVQLYFRLGFLTLRTVTLQRLTRNS